MAKPTKKLKKNLEGFRDHLGIFHPIRSGSKEQGRLYDGQIAGDNDDVFDRELRRMKNEKLAEEIYEKRQLNDALDGALGEERKISLSQFVRKSGGLKFDPKDATGNNRGELRMLSFKESKRRGIAHPKGKYTVDLMREQANEAGYTHTRTEAEFLDLLETDMRTGDVLPFFSADYMTNPTTPANFWKQKAAEIGKAITFFKRRKKPAKVKKLEKARSIAQSLARKAASSNGKDAAPDRNKKPAKRPKKNGLLESAASLAIVATGAVELYDRATRKTPVSSQKTRRGDAVNPSKKVMAKKTAAKTAAKKKTATKKPAAKKAAAKKAAAPVKKTAPVKNRAAASNVEFHESEFERNLNLIEKGDYKKQTSAKLQGKLAGYSPNEIDRAIQYARLTFRLKKNPTVVIIKDAEKLLKYKPNGIVSRAWAVRQAKKQFGRQLRLESQLARVKTKRAQQEAKAKKNPSKSRKNPATATAKKCRDAFYAFQGRFPDQVKTIRKPESSPRETWSVGRLIEIRLKGHPNLYLDGKGFYLVADMDSQQLYIWGGTIAGADASILKGFSAPIAEITHFVYATRKAHLDDIDDQPYIHKLGEEGGERPTLARDRHGDPIIQGGDYTIEPLGIRN